ncbi:MAG: hypothetical protein ACR2MZ_11210 [Candidatus Dormibacter sp.]|uniref:hypothetical protein n=1 Tax=Candidatus Dormibacter sp. TaxID=2973982 RepID=UPI000DAFC061|nr:MAG: hypothetical protein DLM66_11400 [Candidatus Dormibacteraeota bacterium]
MRGYLIGLLLLVVLVVSVLSLRPGGLRNQLRNVARRLKLALGLAGVYLALSTALRISFSGDSRAEWGSIALAVVVGGVFLVLSRDRPLDAEPPASRR